MRQRKQVMTFLVAAAMAICMMLTGFPQTAAAVWAETGGTPRDTQTSENCGGTNMNNAMLLPMNTKLYGRVDKGIGRWFAFTTGADANATYSITTVNRSTERNYLGTYLYDENGKQISYTVAGAGGKWINEDGGMAVTCVAEDLLPNTTYYIRTAATSSWGDMNEKDTIDYVMTIKNRDEPSNGYYIAGNVPEVNPGANQDDAVVIPVNQKTAGTVSGCKRVWYAFTTGSTNGSYKITTVNESVETGYLGMILLDEYGNRLWETAAEDTGKAVTGTFEELEPHTTYYICMAATNSQVESIDEDSINYTLTVKAPKDAQTPEAAIN